MTRDTSSARAARRHSAALSWSPRNIDRAALLAGVSAATLFWALPSVHARSLNGGGAGGVVAAPNLAADAASDAARQAASAAQQTQQSLARAARAVQDMQAVQSAARAAAAAAQTSVSVPVVVPNGLGAGGLDPSAGWRGAQAPTQGVDAAGRTEVGIRQTTQQAILNWNSFNVGARTTLTFDQQGNRDWVALNRVEGTDSRPSQILGNIKADGSVYVINQNGIVFGGASQVNVGSLIASTAKISNEQFLSGIYSAPNGTSWIPSFTEAAAKLGNGMGGGVVRVEAGAQITTSTPAAVTAGGGFVLLMGGEVVNAGTITTSKGQAQLAAGDRFVLRRGYASQTAFTAAFKRFSGRTPAEWRRAES